MQEIVEKIGKIGKKIGTQQALITTTVFCGIIWALMSGQAWASGMDLLKDTDQSFWSTFNGTGKNYLYAAEGVLALATYIKTKNILALVGIVIVAIFINIVLKFAGQS